MTDLQYTTDPTPMIGRNIASERAKAQLDQKDLAGKLGTSTATVSRWERGVSNPDAAQLAAMSGVFGCSVDYLLGLTEDRRIT